MIIIFFTFFVIWVTHKWWKFIRKPSVRIYCYSSKQVIDACPSLQKYNPTPYLNGLLHTVVATFKHPKEKHTTNTEYIGDVGLSVDWIDKGKGVDSKHPLLFIMPGLTGSADDGYINTIVTQAHLHDFHNICIYNYRMLAKHPDLDFQPEFYNYGLKMYPNEFCEEYKSDGFYGIDNDYYYFDDNVLQGKRLRVDLAADLHHVLTYLQQKYNFSKIVAIGCSYGGVQLGMYLGRFEEKSLISAGVTVCSPHIMNITQVFLSKFMNVMLCRILQRGLRGIQAQYPPNWGIDVKKAMSAFWIQDFDTNYTSRMYGYRTADAYYRHFSLVNRFPNIKVPMLCISAEDDGVCHLKGLGKEELLHNGKTILCLAKAGGHIGFLEGWKASEFWFPKPAVEFLSYYDCDFYGIDVTLNYRQRKAYKSFYGGVWSLVVATLIVILCVEQFLDCVLYLSPEVKQYSQSQEVLQQFIESSTFTSILVNGHRITGIDSYYEEDVQINIPTIYEDIYDVNEPLKRGADLILTRVQQKQMLNIQIQMEMILYKTDRGLLWEMQSEESAFKVCQIDSYYSEGEGVRIQFSVNPIYRIVARQYKRIYRILSMVGGLVKVLMLIGKFFSKPITKLKFHISFLNQFYNCNQIDHDIKTFYPLNSQALSQKMLKNDHKELQKQPTKVIRSILKRYTQHPLPQTDRQEEEIQEELTPQEVDDLIEKYFHPHDSKLKLQHLQYVKYFFGFTGQVKRRIKQLRKCLEVVNQKTDIINVFNKLQEVDKLKQLLLNQDQLNLFEYIPKPNINAQQLIRQTNQSSVEKAAQAYRSFQSINEQTTKSHIDHALLRMIDGNIKKFFVLSQRCISFARGTNLRSSCASPQQQGTEQSRSENLKNDEVNEQ